MKIKKDWFGMFSSTREYARSIYVREPTEEVEKRIWTKRIKTAGVLMAALLLSFFVLFISAVRYTGNFGWLCGETAGTRAVFSGYG